ncbi:potassium transporter TrkA [Halosimplex rubrum]|uniref:potassium transporter TrkA n=1 Tax=Halosimplex rubrum TaxID=869889 RepID=UPI001C54C333|nr:potassium transporter TrkA [Halosimplex rubrum]
MASLPVEVLLGISFGLLVGLVPAFAVGLGSFLVEYYGGYTAPGAAAVLVALPLAGANGYAVGLVGTTVEQVPRLLIAALVALLLALYANSQGSSLAAELPRDLSQATRARRTLSAAAIEDVDGSGQVTVRASGEIRDIEGYPSLSPALRTTLETGAWRLPADLPLAELETRLEDRLRSDHDLADAAVSIDARGRASVAAAPPARNLAERVPDGWRAVSFSALLPTGLSPGDEAVVDAGDAAVDGHVLSVRTDTDRGSADADTDASDATATVEGAGEATTRKRARSETAGGRGRVTVAVRTSDARTVLGEDEAAVRVTSQGTSHVFEAFSQLERAGQAVRRVRLSEADREALTDDPDLSAVGVRRAGEDGRGWRFDPDEVAVEDADEAFVVGADGSERIRALSEDEAPPTGAASEWAAGAGVEP